MTNVVSENISRRYAGRALLSSLCQATSHNQCYSSYCYRLPFRNRHCVLVFVQLCLAVQRDTFFFFFF